MESNCAMNNDDKWCLRWDEFDENIREYFSSLRKDGRMFDVTLATEDGQQIQAHKIILSAGSNFFSDIFVKSNHSNMLVYLKGITLAQLEPVINFLYNGETFVAQEELNLFVETAKELKIKGLDSEMEGKGENIPAQEATLNYLNSVKVKDEYTCSKDVIIDEKFNS